MKRLLLNPGYSHDGYLDNCQGRIVLYDDKIMISRGNSPDHLTLLAGLAARYHLDKNDVISNGIRLYYAKENGDIIISPSRKIDFNELLANQKEFVELLRKQFKL